MSCPAVRLLNCNAISAEALSLHDYANAALLTSFSGITHLDVAVLGVADLNLVDLGIACPSVICLAFACIIRRMSRCRIS